MNDADPRGEFRLAHLVGPAGAGAHGEQLIRAVERRYPPELQAVLTRPVNPRLSDRLDDDAFDAIARIAGVERIHSARVHGTDVVYCVIDEHGERWRGVLPYEDLARGASDRHMSEGMALAGSSAARDYARGRAKALASKIDPAPTRRQDGGGARR